MNNHIKMKLGDIILMTVLLLVALLLLLMPLFQEKAALAEIVTADGGERIIIPLDRNKDYNMSYRGVSLTVRVENGEIFVLESDCRDGICLNTPPISRAGQTIVCAPAGVVVRILGEESVIDGVSK